MHSMAIIVNSIGLRTSEWLRDNILTVLIIKKLQLCVMIEALANAKMIAVHT